MIRSESLDVYDLLINGKYNLKERLRSGDVIFVEPRKVLLPLMVPSKDPQDMSSKMNKILAM